MITDESQDETPESIANEVQELAWQLTREITREITILKAENGALRSQIKELQDALSRKSRYVVHSPYGV